MARPPSRREPGAWSELGLPAPEPLGAERSRMLRTDDPSAGRPVLGTATGTVLRPKLAGPFLVTGVTSGRHAASRAEQLANPCAGAGGYGLVKKATHKETGLSTAIKILKLPDTGKGGSNTRGKKARILGAPAVLVGRKRAPLTPVHLLQDGKNAGRRASEMFYSGRKGRFAVEADLTNDDIINVRA